MDRSLAEIYPIITLNYKKKGCFQTNQLRFLCGNMQRPEVGRIRRPHALNKFEVNSVPKIEKIKIFSFRHVDFPVIENEYRFHINLGFLAGGS